jgi:hypothetical protein
VEKSLAFRAYLEISCSSVGSNTYATRLTSALSQKITKSSLDNMANMCVAFEESGWSPSEKPEITGLRVEFQEIEL